MREVKQLTNNKFLNIKEVRHPEKNVNGYQFAERRGVDSIAFICWDVKRDLFLVNKEYTPPTDEFHLRAFGGSLDKAVEQIEIVRGELKEEAGFEKATVVKVGSMFVSTQMNQYCHLYVALVNKDDQGERHPENAIEAMASTVWLTKDEIISGSDWKAISIVAKLTPAIKSMA